MTRVMVLTLRPQQAAVFSARAATLGAHATLDAPSGANLLGWAASKCYSAIEDALHSGRLRFSNAVRMHGECGAFAGPATLYQAKHEGGAVHLGRAAFEQACPSKQAEAVKGRLFTCDGAEAPSPRRKHRLRTAMRDGVADEGRLFGYQSVAAGQAILRATIEWDDADADGWDALKAAFEGQILYLGRAAASGYGGAYACSVSENAANPWPELTTPGPANQIRFWLLSDAMLCDEWGMPRMTPTAADFGLGEGWALLASESSAATRRIWPWNGTYKSRDTELPVIEAGAVFTFVSDNKPIGQLPALIGQGRERGFGRYAVLAATQFALAPGDVHDEPAAPEPVTEDTSLIALAKARLARSQGYTNPQWADAQIVRVEEILRHLGAEAPGASQWSRLDELVMQFHSGANDFNGALEKHLNSADWQAGHGLLSNWVRDEFFGANANPAPSLADRHRVLKRAHAFAQGVR